ncbi:MAG: hypothetical protein M0Z54_02130 [Thermaerobacter sp.]|nr:hypothetical protein [Thermaerobacter sp.]
MTVLVLDDEPRVVDLLTMMLQARGHSVVGARRWDAALLDTRYDAALVDWHLGNDDGRLAAERLVTGGLDRSRVAVMSGQRGPDPGPYRLWAKPFSLADVASWVESLGPR